MHFHMCGFCIAVLLGLFLGAFSSFYEWDVKED